VPITVEGRLWGVIMIALEHERPWRPDTESRLANFTDLAATAIGNVSAHEQLREVADEQAALRRVATLVARGAAPDVIFGAVEGGSPCATSVATRRSAACSSATRRKSVYKPSPASPSGPAPKSPGCAWAAGADRG
jgi:hypothetical protein